MVSSRCHLNQGLKEKTWAYTVVWKLHASFQVNPQHRLEEQFAMVRDADVEQFSGDHALAEVGMLAQQVSGVALRLRSHSKESGYSS